MLDDLDDDAMMELDIVIAKIMQKERKPKMKQPASSKGTSCALLFDFLNQK
jgi:hypothetical protein